jgi:hypothetical protein
MFAVARDLKMTVRELSTRMDSAEFSEWIAYNRYYSALPDSWRETALLMCALLAPHIGKDGKKPKPEDFMPLDTPPQHESQDMAALLELRRQLGLGGLELPNDV